MKTVVRELVTAYGARDRSAGNGNSLWAARWDDRIRQLMALAPSGSGFDNGTRVDVDGEGDDDISESRAVFVTAFHHMRDGMYVTWTKHRVFVRPAFTGLDIRVTGQNRDGIKDYIGEVFESWLTSEAPPVPW
jgi:hypothetical protein